LYYVLLILIGLLVVGLIGGAYEADKMLKQRSDELVQDRLDSAVLAQEQTELAKAKQDIKKYQSLANIAQSSVPQDKDQAEAVREIVNIAGTNGIALSSVTFPSSTLGGVSSSAASKSQLVPVKGISGVYDLQITVQSDSAHPVPYSNFINFLGALERNRRTALVNSVTIQPNPKDRNTLSFTLILDEYIKP